MGIANVINVTGSAGGGEIIRELINSSDGQGLHFDGTGQVTATALTLPAPYSFEVVLKTETDVTTGQILIGNASASSARRALELNSGEIRFSYYNGSSWLSVSGGSIEADKVYHIVATRDSSDVQKIYINGNDSTTGTNAVSTFGTSGLSLGYSSNASYPHRLNGSLYRARIYNSALTQAEVDTAYQRADVPFESQYGSETDLVNANSSGSGSAFTGASGVTAPTGWNPIGSSRTYTIDAGTGDPAPSLKIEAGSVNVGIKWSGTVVNGKKYRAKFSYKCGDAATTIAYRLNDTGAFVNLANSTTWATETVEYTSDGVTGGFVLRVNESGKFGHVDTVSIRAIGCTTDLDLAFSNPSQSLMIQDRAGVADGTASAGVSQTQKIPQLNAEELRVAGTTPKIGVGLANTVTPAGKLHVHGADGDGYLRLSTDTTGATATDGARIGYNASDLRVQNYENSKIQFFTNNTTEALTINSSGNVALEGSNDVKLTLSDQGTPHTNDSNFVRGRGATGLQFNSAVGGYAFEVAGSEKVAISSAGAVTIGAFTLPTADGSANQVLQTNGSGTVTWEDSGGGGGSGVTGSGTDTYVPRWNGTTALEDSVIVAADNGSVGFGIASPSYRIHSTSVVCCEDGAPAFRLSGTAISAKLIDLKCDIGVFKLRDVNGGAEFYNVTNTYHKWYINSNEVMQMNSSGNLLVGCTSVPDASNAGITLNGLTGGNRSSSGAPTTAYNHWTFYNGNGIVGTISTSGSATAYNTSSDYRLKENVVPLTDALDRIDEIPVYRFNFKTEPDITVDGFLADEVAPYVPESVTGTRDGMKTVVIQEGKEQRDYVAPEFWGEDDELPEDVRIGDLKIAEVQAQEYQEEITEEQPDYQQIDQSKLVPLLIAAVKELKAKVEALENA